jgi:hypothetical protein
MSNNKDHSMLTAMSAAGNAINGIAAKDNIWAIDTELATTKNEQQFYL